MTNVSAFPGKAPNCLIVSSKQFIDNFVPPDYLIDGWLQRRYLYSFTALTGHGKTSVALCIMSHITQGKTLCGRQVEQGKALYLAGENPDDVRMRWIKLCEEMQLDADMPEVFWLDGRARLTEERTGQLRNDLKNECKQHGPFALVVVDTSVVFFEGKDENENVAALTHAKLLRELTQLDGGPTVIVNCHPTKNAAADNLLPRGGGAFLNELDGNLTAYKRENICEVHWQAKFRGPDFAPMSFLLAPGTSDKLKDSKGRLISTVTARPLEQDEKAKHEAAGARNENHVLKALVALPGSSIADIARALNWIYANGDPDKSRVQRALKALADDGLAKKKGDHWEATKAGKNRLKIRDTDEVPF
jgi:AAA domain